MGLLTAFVAFGAGTAVAVLNYFITKKFILNRKLDFSVSSIIRSLLNVACLTGAYFIGKNTKLSMVYLLLGAALGLTVPGFLLMRQIANSITSPTDKPDEQNEKNGGTGIG